jgi:integrase
MPKNVRVQALWSKPYAEVKKGFAALTPTNTRSNVTHCKDLSYLATFHSAMITAGVWEKDRIDFNGLKSKIPASARTGQRPPWSRSDVETILSSPIHTGNGGSKRRLMRGSNIYHDAGYWAVPCVALSALRQNEFLGLLTDEVIDDHAVPHLIIQPNYLRELKNESSERVIPIHPRLIDLGFLDYVKRMRHEGHGIVFPELWVNAVKCGGDQYRSISWDKLIDWLRLQPGFTIPVGTAPNGTVGKEADFHSIRTTALSYMDRPLINQNIVKDIAGHARQGVTAKTYQNLIAAGELDMVLRDRLSVLTMLPDFTANIAPAPLNVLPIKLRTR